MDVPPWVLTEMVPKEMWDGKVKSWCEKSRQMCFIRKYQRDLPGSMGDIRETEKSKAKTWSE